MTDHPLYSRVPGTRFIAGRIASANINYLTCFLAFFKNQRRARNITQLAFYFSSFQEWSFQDRYGSPRIARNIISDLNIEIPLLEVVKRATDIISSFCGQRHLQNTILDDQSQPHPSFQIGTFSLQVQEDHRPSCVMARDILLDRYHLSATSTRLKQRAPAFRLHIWSSGIMPSLID